MHANGSSSSLPGFTQRMGRLGTETAYAVSEEAKALAATGAKIYPFHIGDLNFPTPDVFITSTLFRFASFLFAEEHDLTATVSVLQSFSRRLRKVRLDTALLLVSCHFVRLLPLAWVRRVEVRFCFFVSLFPSAYRALET
jgi:hypothetical protein